MQFQPDNLSCNIKTSLTIILANFCNKQNCSLHTVGHETYFYYRKKNIMNKSTSRTHENDIELKKKKQYDPGHEKLLQYPYIWKKYNKYHEDKISIHHPFTVQNLKGICKKNI